MKSFILKLIIITFFIMPLQLKAQIKKGMYAGFNVGYNLAVAKANALDLANRTRVIRPSLSVITETEQLKFSFGKGINASVQLGFMKNDNIGIDLTINYLKSSKTKALFTDNYTGGNYIENTEVSAQMLQIKPSIILAINKDKISPYAKFGVVLGSGTISKKTQRTTTNGSSTNTSFSTEKLDGGMAFGIASSLGINFAFHKQLSFSSELNSISMQYSPKNDNSSTKPPATPFSSIGINVGLRYAI